MSGAELTFVSNDPLDDTADMGMERLTASDSHSGVIQLETNERHVSEQGNPQLTVQNLDRLTRENVHSHLGPSLKQQRNSVKPGQDQTFADPDRMPASFPKFKDLPADLRILIYRFAIGDRTIHIYERHVANAFPSVMRTDRPDEIYQLQPIVWRLSRQTCYSSYSEQAIYEAYAQPVVFKNKIDQHMRPRCEPSELCNAHSRCAYACSCKPSDPLALDLGLLATSREARYEAMRLMCSTNTWSFTFAPTFKNWLSRIPRKMLPYIRHLHLAITIGAGYPYKTEIPGIPTWDEVLAKDIPFKLPRLRSLHVAITLNGHMTCFSESQAQHALRTVGVYGPFSHMFGITEMFRPLRHLKDLRVFTVRFDEGYFPESLWNCGHMWGDVETHILGQKAMFFQRREVRREWAEEIREIVLTARK